MVTINKYFKASALASLTSLLFLVTPIKVEAQPKKIAIFIDGNMDCCATSMNKTRQEFANLGIEVYSSAWNSVYKKSESQSPKNTAHFIKTMKQFISTLPQGTELYLVGHSFGGDSILQFLSSYRRTNVKFKFVAVIDAVGFGGQRSVTRNNSVGSNVEYFYNRWQNNSPWPVDFRGSGNISCSAKTCDQKDQSISRHPDGSARKTRCADHEVTCPGYRVDVSRGYPRIIAGEKQTRLHHQYVPTDPLIETQITAIVGKIATGGNSDGRHVDWTNNLGDRIQSHREMPEGSFLQSGDGRFKMVVQGDGNLVIYQSNQPIWASNTGGIGTPGFKLAIQSDGNVVMYGKNAPIWASNTNGVGTGSYTLVMQNDGNLVLYDQNSPIWASGTCCR